VETSEYLRATQGLSLKKKKMIPQSQTHIYKPPVNVPTISSPKINMQLKKITNYIAEMWIV
jgi:hypothetical protein